MPNAYHLKGVLTFDEYLECHRILAFGRRVWIRGILTVYGLGMILYGLLFSTSKPDLPLAIIGGILIVYGLVISPVQFRYRVKRLWNQYPGIRKDFNITVSPAGLAVLDDKGNPSHSTWDRFIRFHESESLFLLYLSPRLPVCLPKRLIHGDNLPGLRSLLSSEIGNQARGE